MKKLAALIMAFVLFLGLSTSVNAKEMTFFGCKTKGYTKTCSYGYPQTDVGKRVIYKYRTNWTLKEKDIVYGAPLVYHKVIYKYNSKGQLKTNKYGNASRYTVDYYTNQGGPTPSTLYVKKKEMKKYNSNGQSASKEMKYYKVTTHKKGKKYYDTNNLYLKKNYKYNKKGQLKSNKYGKATRVITKYKVKNKKNYAYYIQKGKYNAKGKLKVTSKVIR